MDIDGRLPGGGSDSAAASGTATMADLLGPPSDRHRSPTCGSAAVVPVDRWLDDPCGHLASRFRPARRYESNAKGAQNNFGKGKATGRTNRGTATSGPAAGAVGGCALTSA